MKKSQHWLSIFLIAGYSVLLFGCSGGGTLNEKLGFGRITPDEFAVVEQPPLTIPPNFDLRPPQPGASPPNQVTTEESARRALYPATAMNQSSAASQTSETPSSAIEQTLLTHAKAADTMPNIRDVVDREEDDTVSGSRHLIEEMMAWRTANLPPATTLDSQREGARLREAKEEAMSPTETPTPVIRKRARGLIG